AVADAELHVTHHRVRLGEVHDHVGFGIHELLQIIAVVQGGRELQVRILFHLSDDGGADAPLGAKYSYADHELSFLPKRAWQSFLLGPGQWPGIPRIKRNKTNRAPCGLGPAS